VKSHGFKSVPTHTEHLLRREKERKSLARKTSYTIFIYIYIYKYIKSKSIYIS